VIEGKSLDPLLEALHPPTKNVKHRQLDEKVEQLKLKAVHVAKLVRGGIVRTGQQTEELESREQAAVEYITSRLRAGVPETKIEETLLNRGFSRTDIRRLKKFRIDYPGE
jgi:SOS response regulatory protein OraA/RecX